jgi:hypothetical protein
MSRALPEEARAMQNGQGESTSSPSIAKGAGAALSASLRAAERTQQSDCPESAQEGVQGRTDARAVLDAAITERAFMALVIGLARRTGWASYHTHDSRHSERGFPDLVLVHPGHGLVLFRELKTERGRLSPDQLRWRDILVACGCDWRCWRPRDWESVEMALIREGGA